MVYEELGGAGGVLELEKGFADGLDFAGGRGDECCARMEWGRWGNHRSGSSHPVKITWLPASPADKAPQVWVRAGKGAVGRGQDDGDGGRKRGLTGVGCKGEGAERGGGAGAWERTVEEHGWRP